MPWVAAIRAWADRLPALTAATRLWWSGSYPGAFNRLVQMRQHVLVGTDFADQCSDFRGLGVQEPVTLCEISGCSSKILLQRGDLGKRLVLGPGGDNQFLAKFVQGIRRPRAHRVGPLREQNRSLTHEDPAHTIEFLGIGLVERSDEIILLATDNPIPDPLHFRTQRRFVHAFNVVFRFECSGDPLWRDSVHVARAAWPELRGNGGHGLASLKQHLGLVFEHHDAGEDARAAAEVVLRAEAVQPVCAQTPVQPGHIATGVAEDLDLIEDTGDTVKVVCETMAGPITADGIPRQHSGRHIGTTEIKQSNIDNNHIYLRSFFVKFPADAIGGSNRASAAQREIAVDWGGAAVVMTDLDGEKKIFRKRGWIREFFERNRAREGDLVRVEEVASYSYRVVFQRRR